MPTRTCSPTSSRPSSSSSSSRARSARSTCTTGKGPASVDTLARLLALPALEELDIACAGTGIGAAIAARTAPLARLYLDAPDLGDDDMAAIAKHGKRGLWLQLGDHGLSRRGLTTYRRLAR